MQPRPRPADPAAPAGDTAAATPAGQAGEPAAAQPGAKPAAPKPGAKPKKAAAKKPAAKPGAKPATAAAEAKEGTGAPTGEPSAEKLTGSEGLEPAHPEGMESASKDQAAAQEKRAENVGPGTAGTPPPAPGTVVVQDPAGLAVPVPNESIGKLDEKAVKPLVDAGILAPNSTDVTRPRKAHVFFGIYFFMTGLHGVHVLIGIGIWIWMLFKARTGVFNENYFGPIDYTALYWHLVDLIWIYLFPLLYLIH